MELAFVVGPASSEASGKRLVHDKNLRLVVECSHKKNDFRLYDGTRVRSTIALTILVNTLPKSSDRNANLSLQRL